MFLHCWLTYASFDVSMTTVSWHRESTSMHVDLLSSVPGMIRKPSLAIVAFSEGSIGQHGQFFEAISYHAKSVHNYDMDKIGHYLVYRRQDVFWLICMTWYGEVGLVTFAIVLSCRIIVKVTVKRCSGRILIVTCTRSSFLTFCTWNSTDGLKEL